MRTLFIQQSGGDFSFILQFPSFATCTLLESGTYRLLMYCISQSEISFLTNGYSFLRHVCTRLKLRCQYLHGFFRLGSSVK